MSFSIPSRRLPLVIGSTIIAAGLHAGLVRRLTGFPIFPVADWKIIALNYEILPDALLELTPPILALYVYSATSRFRQIMTPGIDPAPRSLFLPLALIQLVSILGIAAVIAWIGENATISLFIVMAGGLLGGWRTGAALGVWRAVLWWPIELFFYGEVNLASWRTALGDIFFWNGFMAIEIVMGLWVGLLAGWIGAWWGNHRFRPGRVFLLGAALNLFAGFLLVIAYGPDSYALPVLLPVAIAEGVAMAGFAFMVQNAKAVVAQQQAAVAEKARLQAELRTLQAQINPHFLFNALNTVRYFIRTDAAQARKLLIDLSTVFQRVLRSGDFVSLAEELSYVEAYLSLEKARLGERLAVTLPNLDESLAAVPVPALILQPLVENAVVHGIGKRRQGGKISVTAVRMNGVVQMTIHDDGVGIPPEQLADLLDPEIPMTSIGLRNTNGRLQTIYGLQYPLQIKSQPDQGTTVTLLIPLPDERG